MQNNILLPVFTLVALTGIVWLIMIVQRYGIIRRQGLAANDLDSREAAVKALGAGDKAGNNFLNLLEVPMLFYVLAALALASNHVSPLLVQLAWVFVALRVVHSRIHCSYNKVSHRMIPYVLSTPVLVAMWILFALSF